MSFSQPLSINLSLAASRLVLFDPSFNGADDAQAAARIYRPGQLKPVCIYRFFTTGSIEEVIYQRQLAKGSLAVFDSAKSKEKFTKEELADCFTLKVGCASDTKRKVGKTWSDYSGPESLIEQGCLDNPLLHIAGNLDVLSFVHIVEEKESLVVPDATTTSSNSANGNESEAYDSDSADDDFEL